MSRVAEKKPSGLSKDQHEKLISGDENAWREVVEKYTPDLLHFAHSLCGRNRSLAKDIVQETFLEVIEQIDKLIAPRSFKSWLFAICKGVGLKIIRDDDRHGGVLPETADSGQQEDDRWGPLSDEELLSMIEKHLPALSPQQRACLHLRYREGKSLDEIADLLSTSQSTVRVQLSKATSKLRKLLEGEKRTEN